MSAAFYYYNTEKLFVFGIGGKLIYQNKTI